MQTILRVKEITKVYPGVRALDGVDFDLQAGEIHALVGENGAGKSTLIKCIGGVVKADSGQIEIDGIEVNIESPRIAQMLGVRIIHQELNVLPSLSVAENIFLGNYPDGRLPGTIAWKKINKRAQEILSQFDTSINVKTLAGQLTPGQQQLIEIAQALTSQAKVLIMDEPTAALNDAETEALFLLLKRMTEQGIGIIYITHRLAEVFEIADRVTVLRDGKLVECEDISSTSQDQLVSMMVGRSLSEMYPRNRIDPGEVTLEVKHLSSTSGLKDISFSLRSSEVLGVYGLLGSGRNLLANALFGSTPISSGEIFIDGKLEHLDSPHQAKNKGLGYVPAERKTEALILPFSIRKNLTIANVDKYIRNLFFLNDRQEIESSQSWVEALNIRIGQIGDPINSLSGGNQQKVVISRWLDTQANILILNEPTRGVDVGAKVEVYRVIDDLCRQGHSVLMFSSEMPELLAIADRIMVMSAGQVTGTFDHGEVTQELLMQCAIAAL